MREKRWRVKEREGEIDGGTSHVVEDKDHLPLSTERTSELILMSRAVRVHKGHTDADSRVTELHVMCASGGARGGPKPVPSPENCCSEARGLHEGV